MGGWGTGGLGRGGFWVFGRLLTLAGGGFWLTRGAGSPGGEGRVSGDLQLFGERLSCCLLEKRGWRSD